MRNTKSLPVAKAGRALSGDARYARIHRPLFHILRLYFSLLQLLVHGWPCCIPAYSFSISVFRGSIPSAYQYRARRRLPLHHDNKMVASQSGRELDPLDADEDGMGMVYLRLLTATKMVCRTSAR